MKKKYALGIIIILIIIATYFVLNSYYCFVLKFTSLPKKIEKILNDKNHDLVFLYGKNLCGTCPPGNFIYSINENKYLIYIVPIDFSIYDIENLRYAFDIKGKIIKGDIEINNFLKKISSCARVNNLRKNFYLGLGKKGEVKEIKTF